VQQPRALPTVFAQRPRLGLPVAVVPWLRGLLHWPTEGQVACSLAFTVYLLLAGVLVLTLHSIVGDAWSRLGNAYFVLFSRDPHLAAIGFVWNPLPSLAMLPLLPFKAIFPPLVSQGFAANVVSAAFMAGAVVQLLGILRDLGLGRPARLALTAAFALHPMIVLYGANGMSEAPFLFFLLLTTRQLMRWLRDDGVGSLAGAGVALAFAYLTRYEAAAAAGMCVVAVGLLSAWRAPRGTRAVAALADAAIVGAPFAVAFATWAAASWVIVGSPFEIFTSIYGNSAQVARAGESISQATGQGAQAIAYAGRQIVDLFPYLLPVALAASLLALWRADRRVVGPLAVFGGILLFALLAFLMGLSFGWLRFYIAVVPLGVVLAGIVASPPASSSRLATWWSRSLAEVARRLPARLPEAAPRLARLAGIVAITMVMTGAVAASVPSALAAMRDSSLGRGETSEQLSALMPSDDGVVQYSAQAYAAGGLVASYLDSLSLPDGAVMADAATAFPIVLQSTHPRQFIITPDRDFLPTLSAPAQFKVQYIVVSPNAGGDAIARAFPGIFRDGGGIGELAGEFRDGAFVWRVYRVVGE
jgi:hypothetical protein